MPTNYHHGAKLAYSVQGTRSGQKGSLLKKLSPSKAFRKDLFFIPPVKSEQKSKNSLVADIFRGRRHANKIKMAEVSYGKKEDLLKPTTPQKGLTQDNLVQCHAWKLFFKKNLMISGRD